ncbi:unnamed protein product, partial [Onchocerca ochengi]|uniref:Ovule protein n=1 Tax=Onchocerca ochengi TaxID=42157 RepID=A0A182ERZ3_ONCOC
DRNKRSLDQLVQPSWRALQRNRQVIHQPYARSRMFLDSNPTRPLFLQSKYPYHYD